MKNDFEIKIELVAFVKNNRIKPDDYQWGDVISELVLADQFPDDCLRGIDEFSHAAINNTPVLDIKPVMIEFLPVGEIRQPAWSKDLLSSYWKKMN